MSTSEQRIASGTAVQTTSADGVTWTGTIVADHGDGTALVRWTRPIPAQSQDFPIDKLKVNR